MKLMRKLEQGEDLQDNLLQPLLDRAEDIDLPRAEPCSAEEGPMCSVCYEHYYDSKFFSLKC